MLYRSPNQRPRSIVWQRFEQNGMAIDVTGSNCRSQIGQRMVDMLVAGARPNSGKRTNYSFFFAGVLELLAEESGLGAAAGLASVLLADESLDVLLLVSLGLSAEAALVYESGR